MASDDVAAGDGAFLTATIEPRKWTWKSSTRVPSADTACARTPAGPRTTSSALKLGRYLRAAAIKKCFESDVASSRPPALQCWRLNFRKPGHAIVSRKSARLSRPQLYPSRASAKTALALCRHPRLHGG